MFGIWLGDKQVASCLKSLNIAVVVKNGISCTYDDVVDHAIRDVEIRPVYCHQSTKFSGIFRICKQKCNVANVRCDIDIDRVVFDEIHFFLEVHCLLVACMIFRTTKERIDGGCYELSDFVIREAERISFQNADRPVDYFNQ